MKFTPLFLFLLMLSLPVSAREMRVVGTRVNLRARPDLQSEVIGQVERGDVVIAKSETDAWIEIAPPRNAEFWVHGDFLEGDVVVGTRLNVRSGPGVSFAIMTTLERGDSIERVGAFGEWIAIAPPEGVSVWVALDLVMPLEPEPVPSLPEPPVAQPVQVTPPEPVQPEEPPPAPRPAPPPPAPVVDRPAPAPPADLVLIPLEGQGEAVQVLGVLRPAGFVIGRPSRYRLTHQRGNTIETLAYVRGNQAQLQSLLGHTLRIEGHRYWVQGARHPVIVPEQIILVSPTGE